MKLMINRFMPAVAILLLAITLLPRSQAQPEIPSASGMAEFIQLFSADLEGIRRFYDLPWSEVRFDRLETLFRDWQQRLEKVDFEKLDPSGRIDYLLMRNQFEVELNELALGRRRLIEMDELIRFRQPLQALEQARWQMKPLEAAEAASAIAALPKQVKNLRERIDQARKAENEAKKAADSPAVNTEVKPSVDSAQGTLNEIPGESPLPVSPVLAQRTAHAVDQIRRTLKTWFEFYEGYQPGFSWWLKQPCGEASKALEDYAKFLREEVAGLKGKEEDPLLGEPVGADGLVKDLAAAMIPYSAEELIAIGEREFAWCEAEMIRASQAMGFGEDWKTALAKVKSRFVPPGEQDDLVAQFGREAIQFIKDHDLVTVPPLCEETWRVQMISPEGQKFNPYAAYGGQKMLVAYAKDEMKHEDKLMSMRGNNRHFTRIVTAHELIPGHHLQFFAAARHHAYRRMFSTPFFTEGWALYWETRLWDLNYAQTPEDRIGMLFWRMHRCARIIVSLKFHLGRMQPGEMIAFLVDRVGHERLGATSEVRRYIGEGYSPLYQCAYMIGGMQLRALRQELVGSGKITDRQFNDTVLTYNAIPIELIRAGMLSLPLSSEFKPSWRFAGE